MPQQIDACREMLEEMAGDCAHTERSGPLLGHIAVPASPEEEEEEEEEEGAAFAVGTNPCAAHRQFNRQPKLQVRLFYKAHADT